MSKTTNKLLIVGQTPPPWHGQAVATKMLIDHKWSDWEVDSVRMSYSDDLDEVGGFRWKKITHLFALTREVRLKLKSAPGTVMLYPPASAFWLPFLRDVYFLWRTRELARGTAFIFHASGLPAFVQKSSLRRWLGKLAYGEPELSLEVAQEKVPASEVFKAGASAWCPCAAELPELPAREPCQDAQRTILFVGSLMEGKGVFEILKTAKVLRDRGERNMTFAIVGKWACEDFQRTCESFVQEHGLEDYIDFRGQLTGDKKWEAFLEANLFFFPSHYSSEASPIVLMEALGAGLPVVSTKWAGIPAMTSECEAVTLCAVKEPEEFGDAILGILGKVSQDDSLRTIASQFYKERFTPQQFIQRIEDGLDRAGLLLT